MTTHTKARAKAPGTFGQLFALFIGDAFPKRQRTSLAMLEELDDHVLKDIGITRFQIQEMRHRR